MAHFLEKTPKNITEYPNMFKRQGAFPLEADSVFQTITEAEDYAKTSLIAYVGQVIAVTSSYIDDEGTQIQTATLYIISNADGDLIELGTFADIEALDLRLKEVEKFFEATNNLNGTIDTLYELQEYIKDHGSDFSWLFKDVKEIFHQPYLLDENNEYVLDEHGNRIPNGKATGLLVEEKERAIAAENKIYTSGSDEKPVSEKGFLQDEINRAVAAENIIYDADGGEDGAPSGLLIDEQKRAIQKENEIGQRITSLFDEEKEEGKIVDYITDVLPKTSEEMNYVKIHENDTMELNSLSTDKLVQGQNVIIFDCGEATMNA